MRPTIIMRNIAGILLMLVASVNSQGKCLAWLTYVCMNKDKFLPHLKEMRSIQPLIHKNVIEMANRIALEHSFFLMDGYYPEKIDLYSMA